MIAVSDSTGGLHAPNGLDMPAVLAHKSEHGTLAGFAGADAISNEELLLLECDVLAPCALEQVISTDNAAQVKARIICEGANGPVTPVGGRDPRGPGVLVLPDVLANAGGVVVSYFEWVQGLQEYFWKEEEVNARLNDIVTRAFRETWETREQHADEHAHGGVRAGGAARRRGDRHARSLSLRVVVYSAEGCHLCERALEVVEQVCAGDFERVDIGGDPRAGGGVPRVDPRRRDRRRAGVHVLRAAGSAASAAQSLPLTVPRAAVGGAGTM